MYVFLYVVKSVYCQWLHWAFWFHTTLFISSWIFLLWVLALVSLIPQAWGISSFFPLGMSGWKSCGERDKKEEGGNPATSDKMLVVKRVGAQGLMEFISCRTLKTWLVTALVLKWAEVPLGREPRTWRCVKPCPQGLILFLQTSWNLTAAWPHCCGIEGSLTRWWSWYCLPLHHLQGKHQNHQTTVAGQAFYSGKHWHTLHT